MQQPPFHTCRRLFPTILLLTGFLLCACAPPAANPAPQPEQVPVVPQASPTQSRFPYATQVDAITAYFYTEEGHQTLPPDAALKNWFSEYISRARQTVFAYEEQVGAYGSVGLHFGEKRLQYAVWFDKDTGLYDSAIYDENNRYDCWQLPMQTECPLIFELKEKSGERIFTLLPNGKLLQAYSWSSRESSVNTDVELRYNGNLELWVDDTRHLLYKNYAREGEGYALPFVSGGLPNPRLLHVIGRNSDGRREDMLFFSSQTDTNGIGTWETWRLYRLRGTELQELGIAPGHEYDLVRTVELRRKDIFLVFPALGQELPLDHEDFFWAQDAIHQDAVDLVKGAAKQEGALAELFRLWEKPVYIEYAGYFSDRGPSTDVITLWHGVNGPVHYYQGNIKVTYAITVDGLVPQRVSW